MKRGHSVVRWGARILAIGVCLFLGLFALDEVERGKPVFRTLSDVLIHLLPSAVVLVIVALSWRRPWIGGLAFVCLAAAYAVMVGFRLDWVFVISGPLLLAGLLYFWSERREHLHSGS